MNFPSPKKRQKVLISVLIYPDGRYQASASAAIPAHWAEAVIVHGAMVRTVIAEVPIPMEKPILGGHDLEDAA